MTCPDRVRVLVVGDSGVGKTSLTSLIANNTCLSSPGWTVGSSIEVKLHPYLEALIPQQWYDMRCKNNIIGPFSATFCFAPIHFPLAQYPTQTPLVTSSLWNQWSLGDSKWERVLHRDDGHWWKSQSEEHQTCLHAHVSWHNPGPWPHQQEVLSQSWQVAGRGHEGRGWVNQIQWGLGWSWSRRYWRGQGV